MCPVTKNEKTLELAVEVSDRTWINEDFENENKAEGWSFAEISSCESTKIYPNMFLGGPCKLSDLEVWSGISFDIEMYRLKNSLKIYQSIIT